MLLVISEYGNVWTLTSAPYEPWRAIASDSSGQYLVAGMDNYGQATSGIFRSTNG